MKYLEQFNQQLNGIIGETVSKIIEAENPDFTGANSSASPIPGTPPDLQPQPSPKKIRKQKRQHKKMEKWLSNSEHP